MLIINSHRLVSEGRDSGQAECDRGVQEDEGIGGEGLTANNQGMTTDDAATNSDMG